MNLIQCCILIMLQCDENITTTTDNFLTYNSTSGSFICSLPCRTTSPKNQTVFTVLSLDLLEEEASICSLNSFSEVHTLIVVCGTSLQFNFRTDLCPGHPLKSRRGKSVANLQVKSLKRFRIFSPPCGATAHENV